MGDLLHVPWSVDLIAETLQRHQAFGVDVWPARHRDADPHLTSAQGLQAAVSGLLRIGLGLVELLLFKHRQRATGLAGCDDLLFARCTVQVARLDAAVGAAVLQRCSPVAHVFLFDGDVASVRSSSTWHRYQLSIGWLDGRFVFDRQAGQERLV